MVLRSHHAPGDVLRRIDAGLVRPTGLLRSHSGVTGHVDHDRFALSYQRPGVQNSLAPRCEGQVTTDGDGTRIDVRFRFHPWATIFVVALPAAVVVMTVGTVAMAFGQSVGSAWPTLADLWDRLGEVRLLLPIGLAFAGLGYVSWRVDRPAILRFLRSAIDEREPAA